VGIGPYKQSATYLGFNASQSFAAAAAKSSQIGFSARHVRAEKLFSACQCAQRARATGRKPIFRKRLCLFRKV